MDKYNQIVNANSISMSYNEFGEGLSPIIFIHGFPFNKEMWLPQVEALKNTFHIFNYDIRGFGDSTSEVIRTASIDLFAEDLIAFMDAVHIEKAIVCGFSMGGYVLLNAVSRFPDRFSAIILADTQCNEDSPEAKVKRGEAVLEINLLGIEPFIKKFIKNVFTEASLKNKKQLINTVKNGLLSTFPEAIIATLNALANRTNTCEMLHKIEIPTLIICGNEDKVTPIIKAEYLQQNIPNSILKIIKKAGHMSNMEQPSQFNKIIVEFVSNLPHLSAIKLYGNENLEIEPNVENCILKG